MKTYLNLSLHGFHNVCTEDVSITIIFWPCILLGARLEFHNTADNSDHMFALFSLSIRSANETTKQDMTASFYIILWAVMFNLPFYLMLHNHYHLNISLGNIRISPSYKRLYLVSPFSFGNCMTHSPVMDVAESSCRYGECRVAYNHQSPIFEHRIVEISVWK